MTKKIQNPCATCDHHLAGLPKTCAKCERCEKRMWYVEAIKHYDALSNSFSDFDEYKLNSELRKRFALESLFG